MHKQFSLASAKNLKGFGLLELVLSLGLLGFVITLLNTYIQKDHLTTQARNLASQTRTYASYFTQYLAKHPELTSVSYQQLIDDGYVPHGSRGLNMFKQLACVVRDEHNWYLVYVGGKVINPNITRQATLMLSGYSAFLDNNNMLYSSGGWSIDITSNPAFSNIQAKCRGTITPNSLVVNLSFNNLLNPNNSDIDLHLRRNIDPESNIHELTTPQNVNTQRSDIALINNAGLAWDYRHPSFKLALDSKGRVSIPYSHNLSSDSIHVTGTHLAGDICSQHEVGDFTTEGVDPNLRTTAVRGVVTCTYSPLFCYNKTGSNYCYMSSQNNQMNYTNNGDNITDSGYMGYKYYCPTNTPILLNYTSKEQVLNITYATCSGSQYSPLCQSVTESVEKVFTDNALDAKFLTGSNLGYSVNLGAQVTPYNPNVCADNCAAILNLQRPIGRQHYDTVHGCICSRDNINATYKVISSFSSALGSLDKMSCTNQISVNAH